MEGRWRFALLTVSDEGSKGRREDTSGLWLEERLLQLPAELVARGLLPDEPDQIRDWVLGTIERSHPALLVCTGGTGLHPRDRTPDVVRQLADFEVPGLAEAMRAFGLAKTPHAMLSRQVAVVLGRTLVLALPGALKASQESLEAIWLALPHALEMVAGLPQASTPGHHAGAESQD